jgi:hypothetical protein
MRQPVSLAHALATALSPLACRWCQRASRAAKRAHPACQSCASHPARLHCAHPPGRSRHQLTVETLERTFGASDLATFRELMGRLRGSFAAAHGEVHCLGLCGACHRELDGGAPGAAPPAERPALRLRFGSVPSERARREVRRRGARKAQHRGVGGVGIVEEGLRHAVELRVVRVAGEEHGAAAAPSAGFERRGGALEPVAGREFSDGGGVAAGDGGQAEGPFRG